MLAPPPRVLVAGPVAWNLMIDLATLPRAEPHMTFARGFRETLGGTSAGKALNLARLGAAVTLRTVVGPDVQADRALGLLRADGVDVIAEVDRDGATERHVNLMADDGSRVSIYLTMPTLPDPPAHAARTAAALADADVAVVDLAESARPLLADAAAAGIPVWVDLHDYDGVNPFHREFAAAAAVVFLSSDRLAEPRPSMTEWIRAGAQLVVCTHGARGATALDADGRWYDVPAEPVDEVIDTNGAGDAFFSAFLVAHRAGAEVGKSLTRAAQWAARCVRSPELAPEVSG